MPRDATTHLKRRFLTLLTLVVIGSPATAAAQQAYAPQTVSQSPLAPLPRSDNAPSGSPSVPAAAPAPEAAQEPWPRVMPASLTAAQPIQRAPEYAPQAPGGNGGRQGPLPGPGMNAGEMILPGVLQPRLPSQAVGGWTLPQAEAVAMQFNPVLRRSLARIDSAQGDALQAGLYPNPRFDTNNPQVFAGSSTSLNAGFIQEFPVKGKLRLDKAAANQVVRQKEHGLVQDRYVMLTAIRQQFYAVLSAQRRVEVLREIRGISEAAVQAAEGRVQATEGTVSEVLLLQTELQRAEIALRNSQTALDAGRRQLAAIIGRPDLSIDLVSGELTSGFPEFDPDRLRRFVVTENAQVQIARRDIDRNQILLRRARVEPFPNPTLGPATVITIPQTGNNSQQFWFNIYFDIPTWNRNQGGIQAAQANIADATASLGILQNDLIRQVEDALGRYRAARQSEERYRTQILPTARRAAQLVKDGYQKGVLDISTYLQAQRALSDAASNYVDAVQDVWATAAEIANLLQMERFP